MSTDKNQMKHDIIFEVIPHAKTVSDAHCQKFVDKIADTLHEMKNISMLNIPEITEENHIGIPYYRNADNRKFGSLLREIYKKEIMVNTVVVHYASKDRFEQWLNESMSSYQIKNFIFVGAKINSIKYPGPGIVEANSIAHAKKINFGNIFIPERDNEADRLISKTASGCNFFTSQILFEPENLANVISDYSEKCDKAGLKPAKFFLSFSPVSSLEDISFVKWLGAEINKQTEHRLSSAQNIGSESLNVATELMNKILKSFDEMSISVPFGINIEYITLHNLELSKRLYEILSDIG